MNDHLGEPEPQPEEMVEVPSLLTRQPSQEAMAAAAAAAAYTQSTPAVGSSALELSEDALRHLIMEEVTAHREKNQ